MIWRQSQVRIIVSAQSKTFAVALRRAPIAADRCRFSMRCGGATAVIPERVQPRSRAINAWAMLRS
jgi:hypothetical protein